MPDRPPLPNRLFELTDALARGGWTYGVMHSVDSGGHPFVTVEAKRQGAERLIVSWHTRQSGTYRLMNVLIGDRHGTYADALAHAKGA